MEWELEWEQLMQWELLVLFVYYQFVAQALAVDWLLLLRYLQVFVRRLLRHFVVPQRFFAQVWLRIRLRRERKIKTVDYVAK